MSLNAHYSELKNDPKLTLWDGTLTQIPEKNTLVAYHTASSGLVNGVVTGYEIKWHVPDRSSVLIHLRSPDGQSSNGRFLHDLSLPLSNREKALLFEVIPLSKRKKYMNDMLDVLKNDVSD